jgi:malate dehydrogenase (oxaloacetate-decarboxylating)(NADP+)
MKLACVLEIAALAKAEIGDDVAAAYDGQQLSFGPEYIIPKPFDRRLILRIAPKVAFVSHSVYGSIDRPSARKMRSAYAIFAQDYPDVECDGELHGDCALAEEIRASFLPQSPLKGTANILVMPNLDAANILFSVLKVTGGSGVTIGPILLGAARPVHILTSSFTARRVVNMTAIAVVGAGREP